MFKLELVFIGLVLILLIVPKLLNKIYIYFQKFDKKVLTR